MKLNFFVSKKAKSTQHKSVKGGGFRVWVMLKKGEPASALAARYSATLDSIYRWRGRTCFEGRSHTAHQLATTLTPAQVTALISNP